MTLKIFYFAAGNRQPAAISARC